MASHLFYEYGTRRARASLRTESISQIKCTIFIDKTIFDGRISFLRIHANARTHTHLSPTRSQPTVDHLIAYRILIGQIHLYFILSRRPHQAQAKNDGPNESHKKMNQFVPVLLLRSSSSFWSFFGVHPASPLVVRDTPGFR